MPRLLVACEFSGVVRRAFAAVGWDAWSCDLLPAADGSPNHIQGDVLEVLDQGWDMMIAHPPCTYLCNSGVRWLSSGGALNADRHAKMIDGCDLFAKLLSADVPRVAVENPIMHKHARNYLQETWRVTRHDARPTQTIQPWQFGHGETKATCLWLRNLPPLVPTDIVSGREARVHRMPPSPDRWAKRSTTFQGIATAMASQWGSLPVL